MLLLTVACSDSSEESTGPTDPSISVDNCADRDSCGECSAGNQFVGCADSFRCVCEQPGDPNKEPY
ncbi:MAG: hypothetical protein AAFX99_28395, partial [Myxococcota bacterium]